MWNKVTYLSPYSRRAWSRRSHFCVLNLWIHPETAAPPCDCWPEPRWQESSPSARGRSSSAKWPWGATPLCWTTAAPLCLPCPGRRLASWGWRDCMASFFISSLPFSSPCCSFSKLDGDGTNSSNHGGCSSPEALSEAFSLTSCFGLSSMEWCMCTKMINPHQP